MKGKRFTVTMLAALALLLAAAGVVFSTASRPLPGVDEAIWADFTASFARAEVLAPPQPLGFDLKLKDLQDNPVSWDSLRGRVTVVNFWALWCPPCIKELPSLLALQTARADDPDFAVVYVSMDYPDNGAYLQEIMAYRRVVPIDTLYVSDMESWDALKLRALPTTLILDRRGRVAYRLTGDTDWYGPAATAFIDALLGKSQALDLP